MELKRNQTTPLYDQHLLNDEKESLVILLAEDTEYICYGDEELRREGSKQEKL